MSYKKPFLTQCNRGNKVFNEFTTMLLTMIIEFNGWFNSTFFKFQHAFVICFCWGIANCEECTPAKANGKIVEEHHWVLQNQSQNRKDMIGFILFRDWKERNEHIFSSEISLKRLFPETWKRPSEDHRYPHPPGLQSSLPNDASPLLLHIALKRPVKCFHG